AGTGRDSSADAAPVSSPSVPNATSPASSSATPSASAPATRRRGSAGGRLEGAAGPREIAGGSSSAARAPPRDPSGQNGQSAPPPATRAPALQVALTAAATSTLAAYSAVSRSPSNRGDTPTRRRTRSAPISASRTSARFPSMKYQVWKPRTQRPFRV